MIGNFIIDWLIGAITLVVGWFAYKHFFGGGHGEAFWTAKVSGDLMDLHLDVRKLSLEANRKFFSEASALYGSTNGKFSRKRMAIRFFGWYVTEYPGIDIAAFTVEGAIARSIPTMREWARREPELEEAAKAEILKIGTFLYHRFERMDCSEEEKISAQLALLEMMGAKGGQ